MGSGSTHHGSIASITKFGSFGGTPQSRSGSKIAGIYTARGKLIACTGGPKIGPEPVEVAVAIPEVVRDAFEVLAKAKRLEAKALSTGLLHETFKVHADGQALILQKVSGVFAPEIHDNIAAVTRHLAAQGLETFELICTRDGSYCTDLGPVGRWRLMTAIDGTTFERVQSVEQVRSAGALVGRFHAALDSFDQSLAPLGIPFRDTRLYLKRMHSALDVHASHPMIDDARSLEERIVAGFERLGAAPETPRRVIHGDLKISNVLFQGEREPQRDQAVALIDFDTLMRAPLWSEWGDAWRSWCNRKGEDEREASFDIDIFKGSVEGFFSGYQGRVSLDDRDSLILATERMALELATRYTTDILVEKPYFAWDEKRFASAAEHNRVRAEGQLSLFEEAWAMQAQREAILESI